MAGRIFINYRRDDERSTAARIRDRLAAVFGAANVFLDVDIPLSKATLTSIFAQS